MNLAKGARKLYKASHSELRNFQPKTKAHRQAVPSGAPRFRPQAPQTENPADDRRRDGLLKERSEKVWSMQSPPLDPSLEHKRENLKETPHPWTRRGRLDLRA